MASALAVEKNNAKPITQLLYMKKTVLLAAAIFCMSLAGFTQKLGHIDGQELLELMPEMKEIRAKLETQAAEYKAYLDGEKLKYDAMYQEYLKNAEAWPEAIRKDKEQKIAKQEQDMAQFEETANQEMGDKQQELLTPVLDKAKTAIEEVSKANNFVYVFDSSGGALLYKGGEDIMPLVKAKLGIE